MKKKLIDKIYKFLLATGKYSYNDITSLCYKVLPAQSYWKVRRFYKELKNGFNAK